MDGERERERKKRRAGQDGGEVGMGRETEGLYESVCVRLYSVWARGDRNECRCLCLVLVRRFYRRSLSLSILSPGLSYGYSTRLLITLLGPGNA